MSMNLLSLGPVEGLLFKLLSSAAIEQNSLDDVYFYGWHYLI